MCVALRDLNDQWKRLPRSSPPAPHRWKRVTYEGKGKHKEQLEIFAGFLTLERPDRNFSSDCPEERKNTSLKDSWSETPIGSAVSIEPGPRFPFNVIKPEDLWIQQARTWSMFIFNYCSERPPSRCLYLQHSHRQDRGPGGEGPQIVTLVNSSLRTLSRGLGFDPATKGRGPLEQVHQWWGGWPADPPGSLPLLCRYLGNNGGSFLIFISVTVPGHGKKERSSDVKDKHT